MFENDDTVQTKNIDKYAPGGGFIFSQDKVLLYCKDTDRENLKAVIESAHEYVEYS